MISINNISKVYENENNIAVNQVSLTVNDGEILMLLGSSGSGKTTLLKMINRLIEPTSGQILVDGIAVTDYLSTTLRRKIGYVFQGIGLFPHMTVEKNIAIVLKLLGVSRAQRHQRAHELLSLMHLPPDQYATRYPDELSGGQQQRVGVARALAADPTLLLMDEPFGALDAITREHLQTEIKQLNQRLQKTIIFVTHDIHEAFRLADRIAVMHQGKLIQVDTPQQLHNNPNGEFVTQLLQNAENL